MNSIAKEIGRKLKEARRSAGYTQEEMAELLGLSQVGYSAFERGRTLISLEYLLQLPRILDKPVTFFLPDFAVSEEERQDVLADPRLRYIVDSWYILPEPIRDHLQNQVRLLKKHNPEIRRRLMEEEEAQEQD